MSFIITASLAVLVSLVVMFLAVLKLWFARVKRKHPNRVGTNRTLRKTSYWFAVFKKILLGLSDIQLLTGLGMQAAIWIDHCSIFIYHFAIAVSLAYMSTITHLMTMVALRSYFLEHKLSTIPRILLIMLNVGLFCYEYFVAAGLADVVEPNDGLGGNFQLACYYKLPRPSLKNSLFRGDWVSTIVLAIGVHLIVLWQVLTPFSSRRNDKPRPWWRKWLPPAAMIIATCLAWTYMIMGFVTTSSIFSITQALGNPASLGIVIDTSDGSETDWTFGQLLPMFLLALPLLGGWELACGE